MGCIDFIIKKIKQIFNFGSRSDGDKNTIIIRYRGDQLLNNDVNEDLFYSGECGVCLNIVDNIVDYCGYGKNHNICADCVKLLKFVDCCPYCRQNIDKNIFIKKYKINE